MTIAPPPPPAGYRYHAPLFADLAQRVNGRTSNRLFLLLLANLIALIPLTIGIIILWLPYQIYRWQGAPYTLLPDPQPSPPWQIGLGLLVLLLSMILHELLHALALKLLGYRPILGIERGYLLAGVHPGAYLPRTPYLVMGLTPLVAMTITGGIALIFLPPTLGQLLLIALLLNMAASVGDLLVAQRVWRQPPTAVFNGDGDIHVFLPLTDEG